MQTNMKKRPDTVLFDLQQKCKRGDGVCAKCGEKRHLTVDHIIPVTFLEQFVFDKIEMLYNFEENFQILCRYCNFEKGSRIDPRNPKTYEILEHVLQKAKQEALPVNISQ